MQSSDLQPLLSVQWAILIAEYTCICGRSWSFEPGLYHCTMTGLVDSRGRFEWHTQRNLPQNHALLSLPRKWTLLYHFEKWSLLSPQKKLTLPCSATLLWNSLLAQASLSETSLVLSSECSALSIAKSSSASSRIKSFSFPIQLLIAANTPGTPPWATDIIFAKLG